MSALQRLPIYEVQEITLEEAQALLLSQESARSHTTIETKLLLSPKPSTSPCPQRIAGPFTGLAGVR